jgi:PII-like signaling protein
MKPGPAKKVTIYVGENVRQHGEPIYLALLNYLFRSGVAGATVIKGVAGFGAHHHLHTARLLEMSENLPIRIEFVEMADSLDALLPELLRLAGKGLVEVQDTTILKCS